MMGLYPGGEGFNVGFYGAKLNLILKTCFYFLREIISVLRSCSGIIVASFLSNVVVFVAHFN